MNPWLKNVDFVDDLESLEIKCNVCDKTFKRKSKLIQHFKTHSEKGEEASY